MTSSVEHWLQIIIVSTTSANRQNIDDLFFFLGKRKKKFRESFWGMFQLLEFKDHTTVCTLSHLNGSTAFCNLLLNIEQSLVALNIALRAASTLAQPHLSCNTPLFFKDVGVLVPLKVHDILQIS